MTISNARRRKMSEIVGIIDTLEGKIEKLFQKMNGLENQIAALKKEIRASETTVSRQSEELSLLKADYDTLKIANTLLGSDENKRDTKLKINSLIREIDYCIAQMAD